LMGADPNLKMSKARLANALAGNGGREHWMRARLLTKDCQRIAEPMSDQDSSLVSVFAGADALICRPIGAPAAEAGSIVDILPLERR